MNRITKYVSAVALAGAVTVSTPLTTQASGGGSQQTAPSHSTQTQTPASQTDLGVQNYMAVSWYQNSAEAKALYAQGYNTAKANLNREIKNNKGKKKLAIALDIDETVLDNSPYQGYASLNNKSHPDGWHEWVESAQTKPVYGAKDFLNYADKKGVDIYYISDRDQDKDFKPTQENLKNQGLPQADKEHIMLKGKNEKDKSARRDKVRQDHKLIMLFGDNLLDFDNPKEATKESRDEFLDAHAKDFGKKYIIFPNPMYGSWETTVYGNQHGLSNEQKDQLRKQSIKYFDPQTSEVKHN